MIANSHAKDICSGTLDREILSSHESLLRILDFIANELPKWRDRGDRQPESSEDRLTAQLCRHLNVAARKSGIWDFLQFEREVPEKGGGNRKIDLAPFPFGATVLVEGRRHSEFDYLFPIECKRLPTPTDARRDPREYVISNHGVTGGIQRFKLGVHGAHHRLAGMIAYVQSENTSAWKSRISDWIKGIARSDDTWSPSECLEMVSSDNARKLACLRSIHRRKSNLQDIEIRHLWVVMT